MMTVTIAMNLNISTTERTIERWVISTTDKPNNVLPVYNTLNIVYG